MQGAAAARAGVGVGAAAEQVAHAGRVALGRGDAQGRGELALVLQGPEAWGAGGERVGERGALVGAAKSLQSCPTLCDPIDGSPPGSPVPGILQARTLEWVSSFRGSSQIQGLNQCLLH